MHFLSGKRKRALIARGSRGEMKDIAALSLPRPPGRGGEGEGREGWSLPLPSCAQPAALLADAHRLRPRGVRRLASDITSSPMFGTAQPSKMPRY